jgi:hypothetical protein
MGCGPDVSFAGPLSSYAQTGGDTEKTGPATA